MTKIRTLTEAYNYIKEQGEGTAIIPHALRIMVVSRKVPCTKVGKKYLIDMDVLFDYLKSTKPEDVLPGYKNNRLIPGIYSKKQIYPKSRYIRSDI